MSLVPILGVAGAVFALDQASKIWVLRGLHLAELGHLDVLPPFLTFQMAWNRGVNFGLLANDSDIGRWLLVGLSVVVSVLLALWAARAGGRLVPVAAGAIIGGALGNALDRTLYGAVADFLNMSCCGIRNPYSFNIADVAIFAGAFALILFSGRKQAT